MAGGDEADQKKKKKLSKKEKVLALRKIKLELQYKNCLQADKISQDEEIRQFMESHQRLEDTVEYLKESEQATFWNSYVDDIREVFCRKRKVKAEVEEVEGLEQQGVQKQDFFSYQLQKEMKDVIGMDSM